MQIYLLLLQRIRLFDLQKQLCQQLLVMMGGAHELEVTSHLMEDLILKSELRIAARTQV